VSRGRQDASEKPTSAVERKMVERVEAGHRSPLLVLGFLEIRQPGENGLSGGLDKDRGGVQNAQKVLQNRHIHCRLENKNREEGGGGANHCVLLPLTGNGRHKSSGGALRTRLRSGRGIRGRVLLPSKMKSWKHSSRRKWEIKNCSKRTWAVMEDY